LRALLAAHGGWPIADATLKRVESALRAQLARPALLACLALHARLAEAWGEDATRDGWLARMKRGDVFITLGDVPYALAAFRGGIALCDRLAAADPANTEWQRDLSVSHDLIGDVLVAQGDGAGALDAYRAGLTIRERLAAADPANAEWQRDLFVSLIRVVMLLLQAKDTGACAAARRLQAQARLLAERFPQDRQCEDYLRHAAELVAAACGEAG
jgi:hypothetical protein